MRKLIPLFWFLALLTTNAKAQQHPVIMNAFKQGETEEGGGNCASIAFIKMAIAKYGVGNVFEQKSTVSATDTLIQFKLKNGSIVSLTTLELRKAIRSAAFEQREVDAVSTEIRKYAEICFAVMCKSMQIATGSSFDDAILELNDGHNLRQNDPPIQNLLGISVRRIEPHRASKVDGVDNIVVYNLHHAAYANEGYYDEAWNVSGINSLRKFKFKRFSWRCAYKMCGLSGAFEIVE